METIDEFYSTNLSEGTMRNLSETYQRPIKEKVRASSKVIEVRVEMESYQM